MTKDFWVIKYANGRYFCGNNQFDKQLRKARIYVSEKHAERHAKHFIEKPYYGLPVDIADTYSLVKVDIRKARDNYAMWMWHVEDEAYECLNCHYMALNDYKGQSVDSLYCPHCGKYMTNSSMIKEND